MSYLDNPNAHTFADLHYSPLQNTIRAGDPVTALRILQLPSGHYYHLGQNRWYKAHDIVAGVVLDDLGANPMFDESLPDPVPGEPSPSEVVLQTLNLSNFGQFELELIYDLLSGADREYLITRIGGQVVFDEIMERARTLGVEVRGVKYTKVILEEARARRAGAVNLMNPNVTLATTPTHESTHANPDATNPDGTTSLLPPARITIMRPSSTTEYDKEQLLARDLAQTNAVAPPQGQIIGPVTRVPDHVLERMVAQREARKTRGLSRQRVEWPFREMQVGEQVVIDSSLAVRAQAAAHTYAARKKWVLVARRSRADGTLIVTRLPNKEE